MGAVSDLTSGHRIHLLPASATPDAARLLLARALRGFADGFVSVLLASYLAGLGFSPVEIGAIITGTLLGSALLTLAAGLFGVRLSRKRLLLFACLLMAATGLGFASVTQFWPLLLIAVVGTLNPSAGDVSVFLPTEQAVLPDTVAAGDRTALFARYNIGGNIAGALGSLASGVPAVAAPLAGWGATEAQRAGFVLYAAIAVLAGLLYLGLSSTIGNPPGSQPSIGLRRSRGMVIRLSLLFSMDSWGGGLVVQSLLALWLFLRFGLSVQTVGAVFFAANLLAGFSQLASPWLAARIGLIRTMVYTHLPSNVFLILAALMPGATLAIVFILMRMAISQMDVPARQSYVMAVVPPEERAAAASVTNVPRSLASASAPMFAGWLLGMTTFGWPLIIAGAIKAAYDVLLLIQFRGIRPPEERQ
jgi:MFS family permease